MSITTLTIIFNDIYPERTEKPTIDELAKLLYAFEFLPHSFYTALQLKYEQQLSDKLIARFMNISVQLAEHKVEMGIALLKVYLGAMGSSSHRS